MHLTSLLKMEAFLKIYAKDSRGGTVLDIGSRATEPGYTYRMSTDKYGLVYSGLDFEPGDNVDIVLKNPYIWDEIETGRFDFIISGQAFEHSPFMWVTFCEIARTLKEGGLAFIIAPSSGPVHYYPFDCWRYYPDSWAALCALTGLELVETIREEPTIDNLPERVCLWMDSAVVARKPIFKLSEQRDAFYANLSEITAPFIRRRYDVHRAVVNNGPCFKQYVAEIQGWAARQAAPEGATGS